MTRSFLAVLLVAGTASAATSGAQKLTSKSLSQRWVDASRQFVFGMRWRQPVVRTGLFRSVAVSMGRPAVSRQQGLVVVGTAEGKVLAFRLRDGKPKWRYDYGEPFETAAISTPGKDGEQIVLCNQDGKMLALKAADGLPLWKIDIGGNVRAAPASVDGRLVVTNTANQVHVVDSQTGKIQWTQSRPRPTSLTVNGHARAGLWNGLVYVAFSDGYVEAYSVDDGARLWSRPLSIVGGDFADADADPVVHDGKLFVASYSDGIYALSPETGLTIWFQPAPSVTSVGHWRDLVVAASADGWVWGLKASNGEPVYRTRLPPGPMSRFVIREGLIVFAAGDSGLVVLEAESGRPLQATAFGSRAESEPVWEGEHLALVSSAGYLYTFELGSPSLVR